MLVLRGRASADCSLHVAGKSTTLKNFQLAFAPKAWKAERASWRAVIQLNLVRSINHILDVLNAEMSKSSNPASPPHPPDTVDSPTPSPPSPFQFSHTHALLKLRLGPLRRVEADLKQLIGAATHEIVQDIPFDTFLSPSEDLEAAAPFIDGTARRRPTEFSVRANNTWREAVRSAYYRIAGSEDSARATADGSKLENATEIIASCAEDMIALWQDPVVRDLLNRRKIRMELSGGFFLNDIDRITQRDYQPSDNDVVRSRLRTIGVQEYKLVMESYAATEVSREWMIYDVGGSRTSRGAWFPFFDDAHAILFLAPISCFDELLAEDRRVNRLEDSFLLWKGIVQSKLLAKCIIVLFLNKFDLLEKKLANGARVNKYLPSFAERENTALTLARYLHKKFRDQHREYSPHVGRPFYGYVTTAIDTKATASTLTSVRDGVLRHNLEKANFV
ncbi:G-alpha-domain-containing protein [Ganoderma leucocontextum]|nr:G-alpha-domain-containing protein [Ganoderma leucocontextum]